MTVAVASHSFSKNPTLRRELLERYPRRRASTRPGRPLAGDDARRSFFAATRRRSPASRCSTRRVFRRVPELRLVSKYGVGLDMIDLDAARRHGVSVRWTPGVNRQAVAELTIAFMIALVPQPRAARARDAATAAGGIPAAGSSPRRSSASSAADTSASRSRGSARAFGARVLAHDIRAYDDFYREHRRDAGDARRAARASPTSSRFMCRSMRRRAA